MCADDGQAGEISGQGIQVNWPRVIQFNAHATESASSQTIRTRMEERGYPQFLNLFHQWVESGIIRIPKFGPN